MVVYNFMYTCTTMLMWSINIPSALLLIKSGIKINGANTCNFLYQLNTVPVDNKTRGDLNSIYGFKFYGPLSWLRINFVDTSSLLDIV